MHNQIATAAVTGREKSIHTCTQFGSWNLDRGDSQVTQWQSWRVWASDNKFLWLTINGNTCTGIVEG